ncbi:hypothetical protein DFH28DRAFT_925802 [Melampsora americana]|nr:hypothetical protein DFH28DRAFT_925802 [Melampsora americana]
MSGVTKQMMLDWMHIHHPHHPIPPGLDKISLAALVRKMQPEHFSDTTPVTPVCSLGTENQTASELSAAKNLLSLPSSQMMASSHSRPHFPTTTLRALQQLRPVLHQVPQPHTDGGDQTFTSGPQAHPNKRTVSVVKKEEVKPARRSAIVASHITTGEKETSHGTDDKLVTLPNTDEKQSVTPSTTLLVKNEPEESQIPIRGSSEHRSSLEHHHPDTVSDSASPVHTNEVNDLIDFSDTHCLDTGNVVIGNDIKPISFFTSKNGPKKSGVDIFQEERKREDRICVLEDSVSRMVDKFEMSVADVFRYEKRHEEQDHAIRSLKTTIKHLESKISNIVLFEETVNRVLSRVDQLEEELNRADSEIKTHELVLERLMNAEDDDDEASEDLNGIEL